MQIIPVLFENIFYHAARIMLVTFCLINSSFIKAQESKVLKSDRIFLSTAYYDIFEKNISNERLENLVAFVYSFGDKALAKDMILRNWLFKSNVDDAQKNNLFEEKDVAPLLNMLSFQLEGTSIERVCKPIVFVFMQVLLDGQGGLIENENYMNNRLKEIFPQLLEADIFEDRYKLVAFLIQHPEEFRNAVVLFDKSFHLSQMESAEAFFNLTRVKTREKYPLIDLFLPLDVFEIKSQSKHALSGIDEIRSNPKYFINDTYRKLLYREPDSSELTLWEDIIYSDNAIGLEMIYYVIMSGQEYQFH